MAAEIDKSIVGLMTDENGELTPRPINVWTTRDMMTMADIEDENPKQQRARVLVAGQFQTLNVYKVEAGGLFALLEDVLR